ncbi:MAG TPA: Uma2 family endonuclease [Gammaproteobacteria bacterium]|nr:Uma2 family endonuclease [Gammaproteobacteria bacterium]
MSRNATEPRRHRLTVEDYYRMGEVGILAPDARVELIDGEIIDMPPIGPPHAGTVNRLVRLLGRAVGDRAVLLVQNPVVLSRHSAPQPDLALALPRADFYASRHPGPADAVLVIEVADTTLPFDRDVKIGLYARHGIREVWLIDVQAKHLVRYRTPQRVAYAGVDQPDLGSPLDIAALPGTHIDLSTLFA